MAACDDLVEVEGGGVERLVALARRSRSDGCALVFERLPSPGLRAPLRFGKRELNKPVGCRDRALRTIRVPAIISTIGIATRRQADIPAFAADIDAGADLAGTVADYDVGVPDKHEMPTTARCDRHQWSRNSAMLNNELIERGPTVDLLGRVEVEFDAPDAARRSGRRGDHSIGPLLPPCDDLGFVGRRALEAISREWFLVEWVGGKNRHAVARVVEGGIEHAGRRIG